MEQKKSPIDLDELQSVLDTLNGLTLPQLQALKAERVGKQWEGLRYLIDVTIERNEYKR